MKVLDFSGFLDKGINCGGLETALVSEGVGILVKEELCEKVVGVRRKSNRVMVVVLARGASRAKLT